MHKGKIKMKTVKMNKYEKEMQKSKNENKMYIKFTKNQKYGVKWSVVEHSGA